MDKVIGYWWEGEEDIPIIKKEDNKYYRRGSDGDEVFPKEMYQHAMTNPWDKPLFSHEEKDGRFIACYVSIIYDWISCSINGFGDTLDEAILDLISNILDVMQGYDEENVKKFIDNIVAEEDKTTEVQSEIK